MTRVMSVSFTKPSMIAPLSRFYGSPLTVMNSHAQPSITDLTLGDIEGVQALYGAAAPAHVNIAPVSHDDFYITPKATVLSVASLAGVLANDYDANGDALTVALGSGPSHGTLTFNTNGSFIYTPPADFIGAVSFTYHANDGLADSNTAMVVITVAERKLYLPLLLR